MKKTINRLISIMLLSLLFITVTIQRSLAQDVTVSYQVFYDNLGPYGQWVSDPRYGNVWIPNESGDFRPYGSNGHWVMTEYGNTWVSDDPWGWACYHYGRWTYDPYYGWVWIPGYEWAPAWVSWRFGGGYSGWAPLGPGVGLEFDGPVSWWIFVGPQYMYDRDCYHHWRGPDYNRDYIRQTTVINNYYVDNHTSVRYNYGPRADAVQGVTHQPVQTYHLAQNTKPGAPSMSGNRLSIYRPAVNRATVSSARPANVVAAPKAIGAPHEHSNVSAATQPAFRQQLHNNPVTNNKTAPQPQHQPAPQPQHQPTQQPQHQPAPQPQHQPTQQPQHQPVPQPQHQPTPQPQYQPAPQPQHQPTPQPQQRPTPPPPRPQPIPQQRQQPAPPPRPQPMPQQRPQPQPQQRPQPVPQHAEPPHEGRR